jgi:hypothetical protein
MTPIDPDPELTGPPCTPKAAMEPTLGDGELVDDTGAEAALGEAAARVTLELEVRVSLGEGGGEGLGDTRWLGGEESEELGAVDTDTEDVADIDRDGVLDTLGDAVGGDDVRMGTKLVEGEACVVDVDEAEAEDVTVTV